MNILDDPVQIGELDKSNVLGSIQQLGLQFKQVQEELRNLKLAKSYQDVDNIVINGMGGSRLGARVAQRLLEDKLKIPIYPIGSYDLPEFVNEKTLLIISSYSGNTEEPVNSVKDGIKRKAKILVFCQNGRLAEIAKEQNFPGYKEFIPKYNPSNQPRMSIGYQILGILLLLQKCGLTNISDKEIGNLCKFISLVKSRYDVNIPASENLAKKTANKMKGKIPVLVASEHLMGAIHVWRNQASENAKQLVLYYEIPELNHFLLEGLAFPKTNNKNLLFIFNKSRLYHPKNQYRIEVTKKVLDGNKIKHIDISYNGTTKLQQAFELIQFGAYTVFYLSMLNGLDPTPIPWVDYFKKELKEF